MGKIISARPVPNGPKANEYSFHWNVMVDSPRLIRLLLNIAHEYDCLPLLFLAPPWSMGFGIHIMHPRY
jgi:hypothetical protein